MKRNILLLTGNGFIGRNLIKSLNKNKNKISIFIKKENNFKIPKNIQVYKKNIFQIKEIQVKDSIIVLTTLNNTNKDFKSKFSLLLNKIKSSKPKKLILISSVSVYSKKFNNLIILRVGNIFGELRTKPSYIEKIIISLVNKLDFVENKLNLIRSYIYIGEFCRAISKVINNKTIKTNIYNLSNKNYIFSSNQVHKIVAECLNIKIFVKKKKLVHIF